MTNTGIDMWEQGRLGAIDLYRYLAAGRSPQPMASTLNLGAVYLDAPLQYSRFYATKVTHRPSSMLAVGPPVFMLAAFGGQALGNRAARNRAARASAPQWRDSQTARTVVTDQAIWCMVAGRWLRFGFGFIELVPDFNDCAMLMTFSDTSPLHLRGSAALYGAVLAAYFAYGRAGMTRHPHLAALGLPDQLSLPPGRAG